MKTKRIFREEESKTAKILCHRCRSTDVYRKSETHELKEVMLFRHLLQVSSVDRDWPVEDLWKQSLLRHHEHDDAARGKHETYVCPNSILTLSSLLATFQGLVLVCIEAKFRDEMGQALGLS